MQSTLRETLRSAQRDYAEAGLKASQQFNIIRDLKNSHVDDENDQDAARELRRPLQDARTFCRASPRVRRLGRH